MILTLEQAQIVKDIATPASFHGVFLNNVSIAYGVYFSVRYDKRVVITCETMGHIEETYKNVREFTDAYNAHFADIRRYEQ